MLTKPVEAGTAKCEVYWPEKVNETLALKPTLHVRTTYMQYFADFDMRTFEVTDVSKDCYIRICICTCAHTHTHKHKHTLTHASTRDNNVFVCVFVFASVYA